MADKDDPSKKFLEAQITKALPPGEYVNHHVLQMLHNAGVTHPDINVLKLLTDRSNQYKNGSAEYLRLRKKDTRKPTEFDSHLYSYPLQTKQLHEDRQGVGLGHHYEKEAPRLDEELLTEETTENVFRKNKQAAQMAVERCISDAFFAGDIRAHDLPVKACIGAEYLDGSEMDNVITPLFKAVLTASLKKSDTEHRVNRRAPPAILVHNDFQRKKGLSKSFEAQMHKLKADSRKLHCQQRQIADVKSTGNFWRLTQRRLWSRASSRGGSARSPRHGRSAPAGYSAQPGGPLVDHFPLPPAEEREQREARKRMHLPARDAPSASLDLVSEISQCSRELSAQAVSQAVARLEGSLVESSDRYSDDFHTVSDIRPFSEGAASIISRHLESASVTITLEDPGPLPLSAYTNYTSSFDDNSLEVVQQRGASHMGSFSRQLSSQQDGGSEDEEEEDEFDSDEERAVAQARLDKFKSRVRAASAGEGPASPVGPAAGAARQRGPPGERNRATIVRNVHRNNLAAGEVSIHDEDVESPKAENDKVNEITAAKRAFVPFSKLAEGEDESESDEEEDDASHKKAAIPAFSPARPKTGSPAESRPGFQSGARKISLRPQSAPQRKRSTAGSLAQDSKSSQEAENDTSSLNSGAVAAHAAPDLSSVPQQRRASTAGRRTSIYAPNALRTVSAQYAKPSFGQEEDDEFGLADHLDNWSDAPEAEAGGAPERAETAADYDTEDINPEDYSNVNDWLAAQMQALINEVNQPKDKPKRELKPKRVLAGEIAVLFRGFQVIDRTSTDGILSINDLMTYCKKYQVPLKKKDLEFFIWLMDDDRRGHLTFEDVKTCYIDQRKRKKYFSCRSEKNEPVRSRPPAEDRKPSYVMLSPRKNSAKLTTPRKPAGTGLVDDADVVASHATTRALISDPIVLFRLLFFAATQDSSGYVRLMSAFQHYSQLYSTLADERFRFVYQKETSTLEDSDKIHISELIRKTTIKAPSGL